MKRWSERRIGEIERIYRGNCITHTGIIAALIGLLWDRALVDLLTDWFY